jgi:hypothetical protein
MKKAIIITAILLAVSIAAAIIFFPKTPGNTPDIPIDITQKIPGVSQETSDDIDIKIGNVKIETPSADEVFYIENEALRLEDSPGYISRIGLNSRGYIGILGFSEYPLIIREDEINRLNDFPEVQSNSDGTAFLAYASIDEKRVLFYGKDGVVIKISEPNIQSAVLLSDGEEIAWLSGEDNSSKCTVKVLKNNEITVLSKKAASYYGAGLRVSGNALIWYENFKRNEWSNESSYTVILHKDGVSKQLGKDIDVILFIGGGERIFYEEDYELFVQNGFDKKNRVFISDYSFNTVNTAFETPNANSFDVINLSQPDMTNIIYHAFNRDFTQIIFGVSSYGDFKSIYYEEGKPPLFLINDQLTRIDPVGGTGADDISEYYFTTTNDDYSLNVYRFDGELKPVSVSGVRSIKTFTDTDDFLYETELNLCLYDSETGESTSVFQIPETSDIYYTATNDLSKIYIEESVDGTRGYTLYEVKPDGTYTKIYDEAINSCLDGEAFIYLTPEYDLYIYEEGNSEKFLSIGENIQDIDFPFFRDRESGYLDIEVWTEGSSFYNYISIDGRIFVSIEDYLK